ncbi:MAG: dihydropteroate synthase [Phycisphaerales bacterium]|nr:dihydropteroate synthase [Phycisphaerales bacterium]
MLRGRPLVPGSGPFIFGILNVTPDSFSDGGAYLSMDTAVAAACRMADEGADAIDVGGESTRPGSQGVSPDEQIRRTAGVIATLATRFGPDGPAISIDTRSAKVARAALEAGATIINDISALRDDPTMGELAATRDAVIILMHMQGTPADMQTNPTYTDVVSEVADFLQERMNYALRSGIARERILFDPGLGFGKTTAHNLEILRRLGELRSLGVPLMVGPSRKRFIGEILHIDNPADRVTGTAAAVAACVLAGAECIRVHDVAACRQAADLCAAIRGG